MLIASFTFPSVKQCVAQSGEKLVLENGGQMLLDLSVAELNNPVTLLSGLHQLSGKREI